MIRLACMSILASAGLSACATAPGQKNAATSHPDAVMSVRSRPHCIRSTGSLIKPPKGQCLDVPGSSYSGKELRNTGAIDTVQALRLLDPAVH